MLTENFIEFCKVLSVVFGTSCMIFSIKRVIVELDWEDEEENEKESAEVFNLQTDVDAIDYDGMGNQGRFPKKVNFK